MIKEKGKFIWIEEGEDGNPIIDIDTTWVNIGTNPFIPEFVQVIDTTHQFVVDTSTTKLTITNKEIIKGCNIINIHD